MTSCRRQLCRRSMSAAARISLLHRGTPDSWSGSTCASGVDAACPLGSLPGGSFAEGSSLDGFSVGVEAGGWEELGSVVEGVEADFPRGGVDQGVVVAAEQ